MIEIKHKETGEVLLAVDGDDLCGSSEDARLVGANLRGADLKGVVMLHTNLRDADLSMADLTNADILFSSAEGASFREADFRDARLAGVSFDGADLTATRFVGTTFRYCDLRRADLRGCIMADTVFLEMGDLRDAVNLNEVKHSGPVALDLHTLRENVCGLPDVFLQGCGYTPLEIKTLRGLYMGSRFFSCFISHGEPDLTFAKHLLADLQENNVSCWHYKEDLRGGTDWEEQVNRAIKFHDKLVLICSQSAVYRKNVVSEILQAIHAEHETGEQKLFPIRLDDRILSEGMMQEAREKVRSGEWAENWVFNVTKKHIPDFSGWDTDNAKYQEEFKKLLEALQKAAPGKPR